MHAHLREPGAKSKETIRSGAEAAVHGGFCAVVAMPNTDPPVDNEASVAFAYLQSERAGFARVFPAGTITAGLAGESLSEMGLLARAGAVCFTDDGRCVADAGLLRCALEYSKAFGRVIMEHCEDVALSEGAVINEGPVSAVLGINGYPAVAEEIMVDRDVRLAEFTGGRLHVTHVSTAGSVHILRAAKARGVNVTCDVTPHHLLLTDDACLSFDPVFRVNPPLRSRRDADELLAGLLDGAVDCIATDHAPHTAEEKSQEFIAAPSGVIGMESAVGVLLDRLVRPGKLPLRRLVEAMSCNPARILGLDGGTLEPGARADITVLDLGLEWTVDPAKFRSKSRNCPFAGWKVVGAPVFTVVGGRIYDAIGRTCRRE